VVVGVALALAYVAEASRQRRSAGIPPTVPE
jgi:hypothetical protein